MIICIIIFTILCYNNICSRLCEICIVHNVQKLIIIFAQASLSFFFVFFLEFAVHLIGAINFRFCLFVCLFVCFVRKELIFESVKYPQVVSSNNYCQFSHYQEVLMCMITILVNHVILLYILIFVNWHCIFIKVWLIVLVQRWCVYVSRVINNN